MNGRKDTGGERHSETEQQSLPELSRVRGRYPTYTRGRLAQFAKRLERAIYPETAAVDRIEICGPVGRIPYAEGIALPYRDATLGEGLGPVWSTYWVRVTAT